MVLQPRSSTARRPGGVSEGHVISPLQCKRIVAVMKRPCCLGRRTQQQIKRHRKQQPNALTELCIPLFILFSCAQLSFKSLFEGQTRNYNRTQTRREKNAHVVKQKQTSSSRFARICFSVRAHANGKISASLQQLPIADVFDADSTQIGRKTFKGDGLSYLQLLPARTRDPRLRFPAVSYF